EELAGRDSLEGVHWEKALGSYTVVGCGNLMAPTEIEAKDVADGPVFVEALRGDAPVTATLHQTTPGKGKPEARYLRLHATPLREKHDRTENLVLVLRDVTTEVLQQQKLVAIHKAGVELADLTADELADMSVEQRIGLLKQNILRFTKDVLDYEVVEVRLLDRDTQKLEPLLSEGMQPEAAVRELYAKAVGNGVTGYVAETGKSYLCRDTSTDAYYLEGAKDAKSSLTVPLILHDEVIGTFNVESQNANNFSENDLLFLEIFARDVASSLHTLELLNAERATTTAKSIEKIHSAVALPIDMILNDAVMVMESYIGHEPSVVERLRRILRNARDIKHEIKELGRTMAPLQAVPVSPEVPNLPNLDGSQILVVDADAEVRSQAHTLLERYGCVVETAHEGGEAVHMARTGSYQAIIADIRLPDMTGYELLLKLCDVLDSVPLILMTGFGYDREHTMVKARRAGVQSFLYKPFRLELLLEQLAKVKPIDGKGRNGDGDPASTA
ncbi:MAG TPA: response regulator, partial [Pirellulales bacterium]